MGEDWDGGVRSGGIAGRPIRGNRAPIRGYTLQPPGPQGRGLTTDDTDGRGWERTGMGVGDQEALLGIPSAEIVPQSVVKKTHLGCSSR